MFTRRILATALLLTKEKFRSKSNNNNNTKKTLTEHITIFNLVSVGNFSLLIRKKQQHMKVLLESFYLNGHKLGFLLQTYKLELPGTSEY